MMGGLPMNDQEVWNRYDKVPAELKEQPNWVVWGVDRQKPKMPYSPLALLNGYYFPAHAGDRRTWDSFQNAVLCVSKRKAKGIGYEFDGRKIYGVDLDHVIDEQGQISAPAQKIIDTLSSYTEISPSGTGVHIFVLEKRRALLKSIIRPDILQLPEMRWSMPTLQTAPLNCSKSMMNIYVPKYNRQYKAGDNLA